MAAKFQQLICTHAEYIIDALFTTLTDAMNKADGYKELGLPGVKQVIDDLIGDFSGAIRDIRYMFYYDSPEEGR
mgnify:CR=1 FL=1